MIDFRSDTFTRPSHGMLQAMTTAPVGDDVFGEDPSVNKLEAMMADYFGKESALYCPSGTMSNQIGINVHTRPGDEVICSHLAHVFVYEGGGIAFNSGSQAHTIHGDRGMITADQVQAAIQPDDIHRANTSLVCLENTSNRGGGACYNWQDIAAIRNVCAQHNLKLHLDGARLFNALVATGQDPKTYGQTFDSISVCLNKGMGCPMGSVLMGDRDYIRAARRIRKKLGGGMRQAGYMAATGIYAMENNIARLAEDHLHAKKIAAELSQHDFIGEFLPVETNILIFEVKGRLTPQQFADHLKANNILVIPISATQVRMVLHLDVTPEMVDKTCKVIAAMS
ncbi:MAG: aminotransferase class I/II-fold pyridoxal phosphate-dependent enzyme [Chitinophaga sp.]|uniref:threonine aldolase family protein n=1 Tax=Chitinophaga sp. TaxID=1869181 RepID=UPI0025C58311|nr:GntG family PLP-dependent aldolase [Chitinophaga sp.]MBV8252503.1 aminotransferase class I/II-fold pyridoxal phosphate-dependent enzyme [Chitinophaga sp.]